MVRSPSTAEAATYQRQVSRKQETEALAQLKKDGMQVTEVSAAELQRLREKVKPVIEKHSTTVGPDTVNAINAELAKFRGK